MAKNQKSNSNKPKDYEGTRTCLGILVGIMSLVVVLLVAAWVVRWLHDDEECTNQCEECETCPDNGGIPSPTPGTDDPDGLVVDITDSYGSTWNGSDDLNIFFDTEFSGNVIYPYASGSYVFTFNNENNDAVIFTISLSEDNEYDIAMKFTLAQDGVAIVSSWARADDFTCPSLTVAANSSTTITLYWWWDGDVSDENDTLAATNGMTYTLTLTVEGYIARLDDN